MTYLKIWWNPEMNNHSTIHSAKVENIFETVVHSFHAYSALGRSVLKCKLRSMKHKKIVNIKKCMPGCIQQPGISEPDWSETPVTE